MFVLHIDLPAEQAKEQDLKRVFADVFKPAISLQPGFRGTELLRSVDDATLYCLTISFDNHEMQQKWVATDLHQEVWTAIQNQCTSCAVRKYSSI